jgi:hypothetical protein
MNTFIDKLLNSDSAADNIAGRLLSTDIEFIIRTFILDEIQRNPKPENIDLILELLTKIIGSAIGLTVKPIVAKNQERTVCSLIVEHFTHALLRELTRNEEHLQ